MIAMNLKRLQPQQKAQAKIKIQQLLYDMEFIQLPPFNHALLSYQGVPHPRICDSSYGPYHSFYENGGHDGQNENDNNDDN